MKIWNQIFGSELEPIIGKIKIEDIIFAIRKTHFAKIPNKRHRDMSANYDAQIGQNEYR